MRTSVVGNKKVINAWAFYDWANSAYPLVITTAIFPIYYSNLTSNGGTDVVEFFGMQINSSALYSYTFSLSFLIVSAMAPLLSGIADYMGNKKGFLQFFCYLGAASCASLYFFNVEHLELSLLSVLGASIGFWGSLVFYNAYLPEIAERKHHDRISAKGYSLGYIGSSLLLIVNLVVITVPDLFFDVAGKATALQNADPSLTGEMATEQATSFYKGLASRLSFISVGIWWAGFAQITFARLPKNVFNRKPKGNVFLKGYRELRKVWFELNGNPTLKIYLLAFFIYSMGVQTVMLMATLFGEKEVDMTTTQLIATVLIIQFVAIGGAYFFSFLSSKIGNFKTLGVILVIWIGVCIGAYFVQVASEFYVIAMIVGSIMGGVQSLSRSTYSKILPDTVDHASYFSFYDICEKVGIVIGTSIFGTIIEITGGMRNSVFALMVFFIVGLFVLMFVPKQRDRIRSSADFP